jgi:glycosyltransferase involved in cell wall biosynthesis
MRLLKCIQFYFPFQDRGGPVFKVRELARNLCCRGHEVTVLTADLGLEENKFFGMSFDRCEWGWKTRIDGIETIYLSTFAKHRALTVNPGLWKYARTSVRKFDLVHFYGLYDLFGPVLSYFCRRYGVPYLVEPVGMYRPIDRSLLMKRFWHRGLGEHYLRNASYVVATSDMERQELIQGGIPENKAIIRYNGIDSATFAGTSVRGVFRAKWNITPDEPLVLFLSRLIPRKNADMLIAAFAKACPTKGRLVIAGPEGVPGHTALLKKIALECGIESRVIFTGPLYDADKVAAMTDADVFALPSSYENFANAPGEAIACGVPVIVSDRCGISELVAGRAGIVIPPESAPLVEALRALITDRALYGRLKLGCREVSDELDWKVLARQMESAYTQVSHANHK